MTPEALTSQQVTNEQDFDSIELMETTNPEDFGLITIKEFEQRYESANRPVLMSQLLVLAIILIAIISFVYIYSNFPGIATVIALVIISLSTGILLYKLIKHFDVQQQRFGLCCPCCKKSLYSEFVSYIGYIRSKGGDYRLRNTFVNGQCHQCKNVIIETNETINIYLEKRRAAKKANESSNISFVCFIIRAIALILMCRDIEAYNRELEQQQEARNADIFSAREHVWAGDFQKAKKILILIIDKQPNYSTANELLGFIYLQQDNLKKALLHYRNALPYTKDTQKVNNAIDLINERMTNEK